MSELRFSGHLRVVALLVPFMFGLAALGAAEKNTQPKAGVIEGKLTAKQSGSGISGALVSLEDGKVFTRTESDGSFRLKAVPAGAHEISATVRDAGPVHLAKVTVKPGEQISLGEFKVESDEAPSSSATSANSQKKPEELSDVSDPNVREKLETFIVRAKRPTFSDLSVDFPRSMNDVQPYYIYNAVALEQSGATNLEDFFKQRLSQNTIARTNAEVPGSAFGSVSTINLRGIGANQTLVLINGRRAAPAPAIGGRTSFQADINGIPLSAIDRIEVLPASAGAIYGASAVGGVVDIILKRNYSGGSLRLTYENTTNGDAPIRSIDFSYGLALEGGRTHLTASGNYSDTRPVLVQDRIALLRRGTNTILQNSPAYLYNVANPFLGATPNIAAASSTNIKGGPSAPPTLTITLPGAKTPTSLNSTITYVPFGYTGVGSDGGAALIANAGRYNTILPLSGQPFGFLNGGLSSIGSAPLVKSLHLGARREMTEKLEVSLDFSSSANLARQRFGSVFPTAILVPVKGKAAPNSPNPFDQDVIVRIPSVESDISQTRKNSTNQLSSGFVLKLANDWKLQGDYTWSEDSFSARNPVFNTSRATADTAAGLLNPFVDTMAQPLNLTPYLGTATYTAKSTLSDFALRSAGSLWRL